MQEKRFQLIAKKHQKRNQYFDEILAKNILSLRMMQIPKGTFLMGSPNKELQHLHRESPVHEVSVETFFMSKYPVTQAQWKFVVVSLNKINRDLNPEPSQFIGKNLPVEQVNWFEAVEFCARISHKSGRRYRLPSEAEWEYACRAGTTTPFHFGQTLPSIYSNYDASDEKFGIYGDKKIADSLEKKGQLITGTQTTSVNFFDCANKYGLCDMHGNVYEWCQDHVHDSYNGAPNDGSPWRSKDKDENKRRIVRGGSWDSFPGMCRSASRFAREPNKKSSQVGFRIVVSF